MSIWSILLYSILGIVFAFILYLIVIILLISLGLRNKYKDSDQELRDKFQ
jgi:Na+-transporting methylmalonyl-CoA/oxaloacetate decarboxylase gamma subunit